MPSDSNGNYSLPAGYLAVTGQTIQASQHNPPLEDLATSMSLRMMTTGATPMSGPLKLSDGTAAAPSLTFNSGGPGFYKTAAGGWGVVGSMLGLVPVGTICDFAGVTAPTGWIFCFGQQLLQSAYPELFAALGGGATPYGLDATHFNLPDCRGVTTVGRVDMGGSDRGIYSGGTVLGFFAGTQTVVLAVGDIPSHQHTGATQNGGIDHTHTVNDASSKIGTFTGGGSNGWGGNSSVNTGTASAYLHAHAFTTDFAGGGAAHLNVQPSIIFNKIIFAGV